MRTLASLLVVSSLVVSLASVAGAQAGDKHLRRVTAPLRSATLDLQTGRIERGSGVRDKAGTTAASWSNLDHSGFVGIDTGAGACEWVMHAVKPGVRQGPKSTFMESFAFRYCTWAADTASGGPGGSTRIRFYEGYTVGGASGGVPGGSPNGTIVASFTLTGLPGTTCAPCSFGGTLACYTLSVVPDGLTCFADGPIGYSWLFTDIGVGGVLAGTFPFLSCTTTCSGPIGGAGPPDGAGQVDRIDQYCPPGTLLSSFTFTTGTGATWGTATFTSMSMEIREAVPFQHSSAGYNSTLFAVNPEVLIETSSPVLDGTWGLDLDCSGVSGLVFAALIVTDQATDVPVSASCTLLVATPTLGGNLLLYQPAAGPPSLVSFTNPIPKSLEFVDFPAFGQGACLGDTFLCSNGIGITVGTF